MLLLLLLLLLMVPLIILQQLFHIWEKDMRPLLQFPAALQLPQLFLLFPQLLLPLTILRKKANCNDPSVVVASPVASDRRREVPLLILQQFLLASPQPLQLIFDLL